VTVFPGEIYRAPRSWTERSNRNVIYFHNATPGTSGSGANPEQLFAAGWSACFLSAIKLAAGKMKVSLPTDMAIDAEVDLGPVGGGAYGLAARLNVSLPGVEHEVVQRLVEAADQLCPYSRATRGNIDVAINLV
jgi:Ohr subfamily peroxiredoxin